MAKGKGGRRNNSKRGSTRNVSRIGNFAPKRIDPIANATATLEQARKTANKAATARPKLGKNSIAAKAVMPTGPKIIMPDPMYRPYQAVPAYKPKKGGLAARATPTAPRKSTKSIQQAKSAWKEKTVAATPATGRIPKRELNQINRSRRKTRNSLLPTDPCHKKPDSKKAADQRQKVNSGGGGSYSFRKWC